MINTVCVCTQFGLSVSVPSSVLWAGTPVGSRPQTGTPGGFSLETGTPGAFSPQTGRPTGLQSDTGTPAVGDSEVQ